MAFLRDLDVHACDWLTCERTARKQLFSSLGTPVGHYCIRHSKRAQRMQQKRDDGDRTVMGPPPYAARSAS